MARKRAKEEPLQLFWKDRLIGEVTDVVPVEMFWMAGKLRILNLGPKLRKVLEHVFSACQSEEGLHDWPFPDELSWNWTITKPDGSKVEIGVPIVDLAKGSIEWR